LVKRITLNNVNDYMFVLCSADTFSAPWKLYRRWPTWWRLQKRITQPVDTRLCCRCCYRRGLKSIAV